MNAEKGLQRSVNPRPAEEPAPRSGRMEEFQEK